MRSATLIVIAALALALQGCNDADGGPKTSTGELPACDSAWLETQLKTAQSNTNTGIELLAVNEARPMSAPKGADMVVGMAILQFWPHLANLPADAYRLCQARGLFNRGSRQMIYYIQWQDAKRTRWNLEFRVF